MKKMISEHLQRSFQLTLDLVREMSEQDLALDLNGLPSNTIGQQIWCMAGARESYLRAMEFNGWSGFSCSLQSTTSKAEVVRCLQHSQEEVLKFLDDRELSDIQIEFLLALLEHEIQHHGQLIRYFYGNRLGFPQSWKERYTV